MKLWEIPGWDKGVKVRRQHWIAGYHVKFSDKESHIRVGEFMEDDWEPYEEPKPRRKVTLWRPIFKELAGNYSMYDWKSDKKRWDHTHGIVGWESKVVEVDDNE